jgi:hypothetical protein
MILAVIIIDAHAEPLDIRQEAKIREQAWLVRHAESFNKVLPVALSETHRVLMGWGFAPSYAIAP